MTEAWWKEAVVYQIYPRSFMDSNGDGIGDLKGIISRLDYLKDLGVDVIWLSPIFSSPNDDNGYDISDYRGIMDDFGTMEDFDLLLAQMHARGLKLMMDLVVNHTSDEHAWFRAACEDPSSPYRDYYFFRDGKEGQLPNNWASHFGFSAWEKEPSGDQYFLHLYTKKQPDLNWDNPKVRAEVYSIMQFWADKGIDGFRMDVINYISKVPSLPAMSGEGFQLPTPYIANGPHVHEYLQEMNQRVLSKGDYMTVGEMVSVTTDQAKLYTHEDRRELNMVFTFEHMYIDAVGEDKWNIRPWQLTELKDVFTHWQTALEEGCWNSLYLNNHDQARMVSRFGNDKEYRVQSAKMLATFLHTLQGTPYIYQGEELGMTNIHFDSIDKYRDIDTLNHYKEAVEVFHQDPADVMKAIAYKGRDNARTPMQWDTTVNAGFTTAAPWLSVNPNHVEINAAQEIDDPQSVYHYYKRLIELRKQCKVMVYGTYELLEREHPQIYAYTREYQGAHLLVLLNFSGEDACITLSDELSSLPKTLLISNYASPACAALHPYEAQVWHWNT
ncbi:MAG: alpha-glucosidase [Clostridiales bacterium]|nr:alpha-glucosidase [Clostridiales bacterium]